jgi:hypothetical protein
MAVCRRFGKDWILGRAFIEYVIGDGESPASD